MKKQLVASLVLGALACSGVAPEDDAQLGSEASALVTDTAAASSNDVLSQYHPNYVSIAARGNIDIVFFGDSITDYWQSAYGATLWRQYFQPLKAVDFGVASDATQNVLWRIRNGELNGTHPKLVALMIGINNLLQGNTPEDTAVGVKAVLHEIQVRAPGAKILLQSVLTPDPTECPRHVPGCTSGIGTSVTRLNGILSTYANGSSIVYLDLNSKFRASNGSVLPGVFHDGLHPSTLGYQIWANNAIDEVRALSAVDVKLADVNGDGKPDRIARTGDNRFIVSPKVATGFGPSRQWMQHGGPYVSDDQAQYPDVNGDGKADLVFVSKDNHYWVSLSTGTGFGSPQNWITHGGGYVVGAAQYANVNGDRMADLVVQGGDNTFWLSLSTGSGFTAPRLAMQHGGSFVRGQAQYADVNADSKADLVFQGADNQFWVSLSTGTTFGPPKSWIDHGGGFVFGQASYSDLNGDHRADLTLRDVNGHRWISYSTGLAFGTPFFVP